MWAPAGDPTATATGYFDQGSEDGLASGSLASPLQFLDEFSGPMTTLRLVESAAGARCCGSPLMVEFAASTLVFRGTLHRPAPGPAAQLLELERAYPRRQAGEWAACEWNSRWLDPVEPAGVLFSDERVEGGRGPAAYVLWRDVDGRPRAWERLGDPLVLEDLAGALGGQFRYVDRDQELLVVDRSPVGAAARGRPLSDELVQTEPFATPPLPAGASR